jgi:hypothetical protein
MPLICAKAEKNCLQQLGQFKKQNSLVDFENIRTVMLNRKGVLELHVKGDGRLVRIILRRCLRPQGISLVRLLVDGAELVGLCADGLERGQKDAPERVGVGSSMRSENAPHFGLKHAVTRKARIAGLYILHIDPSIQPDQV